MQDAPPRLRRFEEAQRKVGSWLRQAGLGVRALSGDELAKFPTRNAVAGWAVPYEIAGKAYVFHLLLPLGFPDKRARVAVASEEIFLRWPHVEEDGVVCPPPYLFSPSNPAENVERALSAAIHLATTSNGQANDQEFEREFVSYWGHQSGCKGKPEFLTLFDPSGGARQLRTYDRDRFVVIADSKGALERWLENSGTSNARDFGTGLYLPLQKPLIPPFSERASELIRLAKERMAIDDIAVLDTPFVKNNTLRLVLQAEVEGRRGLVGATIRAAKDPNGFRPGKLPFPAFVTLGTVEPTTVVRGDPSWIHGRDTNQATAKLANSTVAIVGCGALGSHVAIRLAQAGVGSFRLVDPELLESANVGRHALGMESLRRGKAASLELRLKRQFPHLQSVTSHPGSIETLKDIDKVLEADLIVSTVGEAGPELFLNQLLASRSARPPVVYGWMEERAAAAHALTIVSPSHCLQCILDDYGNPKAPETEWGSVETLKQEPGCGNFFQPFGPVDVGRAELIVSDAVLKVLSGGSANEHFVYTTSDARLKELGGNWTAEHFAVRPSGWLGPLSFYRDLPDQRLCASGAHSS